MNKQDMPAKVLWAEGQHLMPHHFQQQDWYHEARLHRISAAIDAHLWGVQELSWDMDALSNNRLSATSMSLFFPDGEVVDAPKGDPLPDTVELGELPAEEDNFIFHAALPMLKAHGGNFSVSQYERNDTRFAQVDVETPDLFSESLSIEMGFLKKRVQLLSQLDSRKSCVSVPVVRLRRKVSGGFEIDPAFMPPCVGIGATPLHLQLCQLTEKIKAKIEVLHELQREPRRNVIELRSGDVSVFWLLNTLSAAYGPLMHFVHFKRMHPERLYLQLTALAGALMAFSKEFKLGDIPKYNHLDPGPVFATLDDILRNLIDTVISQRYLRIPVAPDAPNSPYFVGKLDSPRIDEQTVFYIGITGDLANIDLAATVAGRFKVGSPDDVRKFVASAVGGVPLIHAPHVPGAIPVRPDAHYYSLQTKGPIYERMLKAQAISIFNPLYELDVELIALTA